MVAFLLIALYQYIFYTIPILFVLVRTYELKVANFLFVKGDLGPPGKMGGAGEPALHVSVYIWPMLVILTG
jgi:hypothetical protein